nr:hypothetical protein [Tanacetum cinerariifolium]
MHKRPTGKIGVYTRFFKFTNFWLPVSTFLVDVLRDPLPKFTEFNTDHYAFLVAHPVPFQNFLEPFLCLVRMSRYYTLDEDTYPRFLRDDGQDMDLFAFIHVVNPTKVKIGGRDRAEGEKKLLNSIGGITDRRDSTVGGGHNVVIEPVADVEDTFAENLTSKRRKRHRNKRPVVTDASGSSILPRN